MKALMSSKETDIMFFAKLEMMKLAGFIWQCLKRRSTGYISKIL